MATYNVLDGGAGRLDDVAQVVAAAAPDAVALVEATTDSAAALASRLDLTLSLGEGNSPIGHHVAWLTRTPPCRVHNHRLPALAKTLLEIELGGVRLFAAHLASRHEDDVYPREGEVAAILESLERVEEPHLLVAVTARSTATRASPIQRTRRGSGWTMRSPQPLSRRA